MKMMMFNSSSPHVHLPRPTCCDQDLAPIAGAEDLLKDKGSASWQKKTIFATRNLLSSHNRRPHNTRLSDQDEMNLCHAPCPDQRHKGDLVLFFRFRCARYQHWVLHVKPSGVSLFVMCVFHIEIQNCQAKNYFRLPACFVRSGQQHLGLLHHLVVIPNNVALPSTIVGKSYPEPITTQVCRKTSEGTHTENTFPNWGDEQVFKHFVRTYRRKMHRRTRQKFTPKTRLAHPCSFKGNIGRGFSPDRLDCLANPMEPLSVSSKMTRATNLRMPHGKPRYATSHGTRAHANHCNVFCPNLVCNALPKLRFEQM